MISAFFQALFQNPFLLTALFAGLIASLASGVIGSYVVIKRIVFISGSIAHSVLSGIGISLWLERAQGITYFSPLFGALASALMSALLIGWVHLHYREREDSIIAAIWSIGMAIGVLFISQTPGFNVELTNFLVGNIMWTTASDLYVLLYLDALVLFIVFLFHKHFLAICFDEEQAILQGLRVEALYMLLLSLIALTVVLLVHIVGIILVITMLAIPPTLANLLTSRMTSMMAIATLIGCVFSFIGTLLAYHFDTPTGATISLLAGAVYLIALVFSRKR